MDMTEMTRLMTELRRLGLTDTQIVDLILHIESGADVHRDAEDKKD